MWACVGSVFLVLDEALDRWCVPGPAPPGGWNDSEGKLESRIACRLCFDAGKCSRKTCFDWYQSLSMHIGSVHSDDPELPAFTLSPSRPPRPPPWAPPSLADRPTRRSRSPYQRPRAPLSTRSRESTAASSRPDSRPAPKPSTKRVDAILATNKNNAKRLRQISRELNILATNLSEDF